MKTKFCSLVLLGAAAAPALGQVIIVPENPQVGSSNPMTAEPLVPRPASKPCTVQLFQNLEFANYSAKTFSFVPPADCPAPWAKVVFTADFTVTAGRQYDRTAAFYLGHANIYYGTTAEPSSAVSPSWHVERDVSDLGAIFESPQSGEADLGNFVGVYNGVDYNGIIYANAALEFYPAAPGKAPEAPRLVVPLPDAEGGAATLSATASTLSQAVTLPRNSERVYLDVISQSQSNDEFWYTCVPNDLVNTLESCGNTAFRETEISIDGEPAGVAPVYPWIYTGGIDPYLWRPIPGVQTLDFKPYRVDLSPFAGLLADGQSHTVSLSVYNADSYFLATANLLVYTDPGASQVTGALKKNTLAAAPAPVVAENIRTDSSGNVTGTVSVKSARNYAIEGYVLTSHGRVDTRVSANLDFVNTQTFKITATDYVQDIVQSTTIDSVTTTDDGKTETSTTTHITYPLVVNYGQIENADGSFDATTTTDQRDSVDVRITQGGDTLGTSRIYNEVAAADTLEFSAAGAITGNRNQSARQQYVEKDSTGTCYSRVISGAAGVLTSVKNGGECQKK